MIVDTLALAAEVVTEARGWLADCGLRTHGMSDTDVLRTVARHYDGGWRAFAASDPAWQAGAVRVALSGRYGYDVASGLYGAAR